MTTCAERAAFHTATRDALRAAAQRGRLEAHQGSDGQWLSTRKAVTRYKKSRRQGARRTPREEDR